MITTLLGIKKGMTSSYDNRGRRVGATIVEVQPNFITQLKTSETKDGYNAIQIGSINQKNIKKPQQGHLKKAGVSASLKHLAEIRTEESADVTLGQEVAVNTVFQKGDLVKVTGVSKGKGFAGGVKRFGFKGGPKTHGQSDRHRAPGSSGSGTTPGRVYKGKRRPGHMGVDTVSYLNLEVVAVDKAANLLTIKGGVPGANGGLVRIEKTGQVKGYVPEAEVEESANQQISESEEQQIEEVANEVTTEVQAEVVEESAGPTEETQDQSVNNEAEEKQQEESK